MSGETTLGLKVLIGSLVAGLAVLAFVTIFGAMELATRLGLPPMLGLVAGFALASIALPRIAMAFIGSIGARLLVRSLLSPKSLQARLTKLDRRLARQRRQPNGDAAVADTLHEKVVVLDLLHRRPEAELARDEAVLLATYSEVPEVRDRLEEFEQLLREKPERP